MKLVVLKKEKGFTVVELVIVIAILGILAAVVIPQFSQYRIRAYDAEAKTDLARFYDACEEYYWNKQIKNCNGDKAVKEKGLENFNKRVVIDVKNGSQENFSAVGSHIDSGNTFEINDQRHISTSSS